MKRSTISEATAGKVFDILLKEAGANESDRDQFLTFCKSQDPREFRFQGKLGFGGKFWIGSRLGGHVCPWYVTCYVEDLKEGTEDKMEVVLKTNTALELLWKEEKGGKK